MRCVISPSRLSRPSASVAEQPVLRLVDVPGAGEPRVRRLEEHVAVGAGHLDVAAVQVVVEVDVLRLAARAADDDDLAARRRPATSPPGWRRARRSRRRRSRPRACRGTSCSCAFDVAGRRVDDVVGPGGRAPPRGASARRRCRRPDTPRPRAGTRRANWPMMPRPSTAADRPSVMPARIDAAQAVAGDAGQGRLLERRGRRAASTAGRARGRSSAVRARRGCRGS